MQKLMRVARSALVLTAAMALSACGDIIPQPQPAPKPSFTAATPQPPQPQTPLQRQPAIAGIIGADAGELVKMLGEPRLDIRDPAARKLQFSDGRCILDAYLYPSRTHREPIVTYAEARLPDGTAMDWATCAAQLKTH